MADSPRVSVIVCTHNPPPRMLAWALRTLEAQTLSPDEWELIIIDSGSTPPLATEALGLNRQVRLHREEEPGLVRARWAGIRLARAGLLVFVDDDNALAPDYLANALAIADREPRIGAFGGKSVARLPHRIPPWKTSLLGALGIKDDGDAVITSNETFWGPWEPMGAGMAIRANVAALFVDYPGSARLGRTGKGALSGDDSLLARLSYGLGYSCSYQPALVLQHYMKRGRLRSRQLARTYYGHGLSYVNLERLLGRDVERPSLLHIAEHLPGRLWWHVKNHGLRAGLVRWCWDIGYFRQARTHA